MTDNLSKKQRTFAMSQIRSKGNISTEIKMIHLLKVNRISGWRRHFRIIGNPDFVFPKAKLAIFIDGCFWHGCPKCYTKPKSNTKYWQIKIERNIKRDKIVIKELKKRGWKVLRIWEHSLKSNIKTVINRLQQFI